VLELGVGLLDLAGAGADGARHPVQVAQLVDDRALDARDRVRLELDLALRLEALDRVDEADEPVGDEVRLLHVRREAGRHAAGDVLHERRVRDDQALARSGIAAALVAPPQFLELDGLDVRVQRDPLPGLQARGCARV
jgi:hypothetical protein